MDMKRTVALRHLASSHSDLLVRLGQRPARRDGGCAEVNTWIVWLGSPEHQPGTNVFWDGGGESCRSTEPECRPLCPRVRSLIASAGWRRSACPAGAGSEGFQVFDQVALFIGAEVGAVVVADVAIAGDARIETE